jgi:hypothetical protein
VDEKFFFSFCLAELMELKNKNREPETHAEKMILEKKIFNSLDGKYYPYFHILGESLVESPFTWY